MSSIKGYRALTAEEITTINKIKDMEIAVGELWRPIAIDFSTNKRWASIAKTHFEEGFMALVRSIAKPEERF
jgi:hypothetical protein